MANTFITSDTHFGHAGVTRFVRADGTKLRPWDNIEEMDEALVNNWNSVVGPNDRVYHVGDVVMNRRRLEIVSRLNGVKILIKGNHDAFPIDEFTKYFQDVCGSKSMQGMVLTHIPIHTSQVARFGVNVHGHLHDGFIEHPTLPGRPDPRYYCVCVEQTNYTPISLDDLRARIAARQAEYCEPIIDTTA